MKKGRGEMHEVRLVGGPEDNLYDAELITDSVEVVPNPFQTPESDLHEETTIPDIELPPLTEDMVDDVWYILGEFGGLIADKGVDYAESVMEDFFDSHMVALPKKRAQRDGLTGEHDLHALAAKTEFLRLARKRINDLKTEEQDTVKIDISDSLKK